MANIAVEPPVNNARENRLRIQRAFDKLTAPPKWDIVQFPAATYVIDGALHLRLRSRYEIRGAWATIKMDKSVPGNVPLIVVDRNDACYWQRLMLDGNHQNRSNVRAGNHHNVWFLSPRNMYLFDIWSANSATDGFYIGAWDPTRPCMMPRNIKIQGGGTWGCYRNGLTIAQGVNVEVFDGWHGWNGWVLPRSGIYMDPEGGVSGVTHENIAIYRCNLFANAGLGISMIGGWHNNPRIFRNYFYNNLQGGARVSFPTTFWRNVFEGQYRSDSSTFGQIELRGNSGTSWIGECSFKDIHQGRAVLWSSGSHSGYVENCCFQQVHVPWAQGSFPTWKNSLSQSCPSNFNRLGW